MKKLLIAFSLLVAIAGIGAFINTDAVRWDIPTTYSNGVTIPPGILATSEVALSATAVDLNSGGAYMVKKVVPIPGDKVNLSDLFTSSRPSGNYSLWVRLTTNDTNVATSVWTPLSNVFFDRLTLGAVPNIRIVPR